MIVRNSAKCALCGDEIVSKYRHDFVRCKCGEIFVDGGNSYLRRGASTSLDNILDTSLHDVKPLDIIREDFKYATKRYKEGTDYYEHMADDIAMAAHHYYGVDLASES